eukprot:12941913-Alexandrium_andersonii.AAC.1
MASGRASERANFSWLSKPEWRQPEVSFAAGAQNAQIVWRRGPWDLTFATPKVRSRYGGHLSHPSPEG